MDQTFIEPHIAIGRIDECAIDQDELLEFIEKFIEFIDALGYECGGYWNIISEDD